MIENEDKLIELLNTLDKEEVLKDFILIGSWAMVIYRELFKNYRPTIMTVDVDFYVPNPKSVCEKNSVINSFKNINYDITYDRGSNKSKFISPDGFTVEFLAKLNRDRLSTIELGKTKIYAESLPYVDIFNNNYLEVNYKGVKVKVIHPAVYVLQKLLINSQRKDKAEKDISSITELMQFINKYPTYLNELKRLFSNLPKSWKKKINKAISDNNLTSLFSINDF